MTPLTRSAVARIYDRAYLNPGIMGTQFDTEYSAYTKQALLRPLLRMPHGRLLDLGSGDGDLWQYVAEGVTVTGIDISIVGIGRARRRFPSGSGVVGVFEELPYADGTFDIVVAADSLEHAADLPRTIREVHRVLRPDGLLAASVPTPTSLRKWAWNQLVVTRPSARLVVRLLRVVMKRRLLFGRADFQPIDRDLTPEAWSNQFKDGGFELETAEWWPPPPRKAIVQLLVARRSGR